MENKEFKAESKRLLDLMINSIYTNKEIFLRELISNASDAIDKLYYISLTDKNLNVNRDDLEIKIEIDKDNRILKISDNGLGMNKEDLENNLGTIAKSGSLAFKNENDKKEDIDIIGQFGVGFYSSFMVSEEVQVLSKAYNDDKAYLWKSKGVEGYSIEESQKDTYGTVITLKIKPDSDEENYSEFLDQYKIQDLIKNYSDYIRYPIKMNIEKRRPKEGTDGKEFESYTELETLNSMIPIWKRKKSDLKDEDYNNFYKEKFNDFQNPLKVIHTSIEGGISYNAILYIPSHLPFDYYTKEYEKGLQLYSNGVLITDKCKELLPDYFGFVKGLVDSPDLSLNISREMLQHDRQLKVIAKNIEKKIKQELLDLLNKTRDEYIKFYNVFGTQIKYGVYQDYGMYKDLLKDLLMFYSSKEKKLITLDKYVSNMPEDQKNIYYACGESIDKIDLMPQVELLKDKNIDVLYFTEDIDEFVIQVLLMHKEKTFKNICSDNVDLDSDDEKEKLKSENEKNKDMFTFMKEAIDNKVEEVRFTHRLKNHPMCLSSEGMLSLEMEKTLNAMPNNQDVKAQTILEINENHEIANKLKDLYQNDKEGLKKYTKILYQSAKLIEGLNVDDPLELSNLICELMTNKN